MNLLYFGSLTCIVFVVFFNVCVLQFGVSSNVDLSCGLTDSIEVQALRDAARVLGKPDWNCTNDPCETSSTCWFSDDKTKLPYVNQVTCLCQDGKNHINNISFKGQDLSGVLPTSLSKLPFLQLIDLSRNLLSGSIPKEWASLKNLKYLSVMANNLSGPIPVYLGSITSLTYISLESNRFSGAVPAELGQLVNLQNLTLSDNNLTGQLPEELNNLTNLVELKLSSNNFNGRLPDYFGSWLMLRKLDMQGSGFEGPVPPSISLLRNALELRISDLTGNGSKFPSLQNMTNLKRLVLRNCNISGSIPDYIAKNLPLDSLDLSFNSLDGTISSDSDSFQKIKNMYLMHNMLTGEVPDWITINSGRRFSNIDLSYNLLNEIKSSCDDFDNINLFRSFKGESNLESTLCLRKDSNSCSKDLLNSLHINCGGERTRVGKTTYEQDNRAGGAAKFVRAGVWGFCSSGDYLNVKDISNYIVTDSTPGLQDSKLFQQARISATSLTYYGLCLARGKYTVTLQFSEIVFASNKSFSSLGNRKFDIYIQETLVYRNFDILSNNEMHQPAKMVFPNIHVNNSIEIRLYYAGKGSTAIPARKSGAYGPLISAISVESEFKPPLSGRTIIWITVVSVALLILFIISILGVFWWRNRRKATTSREEELLGLDLQTGIFTYRQLKAATNNFDANSKIGEGGFGSVYLGTLLDGTNIAVKKLSSKSSQGNREFINEIGMISGLHHPNLVRLYGCCAEGNQLFVIYEYMENNNLARALFDDGELILNWATRQKISIDVAKGLTFLHEESTFKIVHRDIKATNILLDKNLNAKISDFGLAKLDEEDHTHISTRIAGTVGYMAPEYALWGYLTYKADVYSFGVVLLEIVAGRSNTKFRPEENHFCLLDKAFVLQQKGDLTELVDARLGMEYNEEEAVRMLKVALMCTNASPELRPTMSVALSMLEGTTIVPVHDSTLDRNMQTKWLYHVSRSHNEVMSEKDTQSLIISGGAPGYASSSRSNDNDLYPINFYSDPKALGHS
ncbi:putative LRR receptor-like serine/threonine-protein kinase At1g53440 isoform X2 [Silene latifolia]|uniref:putative LRR receptor-like serine/threonine-protein kinase At1g53440 isoform X2 n=1 Tax=Silene latifolia TaxID=37657 RepID=UPI003D76CE89